MIEISGAGKKKKPKKQRPPKEAPNTLQSSSRGQILDLIGYGPIKGLVNGLQSVYLDDTPLENPDGTFNHEGVTVDARWGEPDQDVIPGFKSVSNPREINAEVTYDAPVVRTLLNNEADAVIVTVRVPALVSTNTSTGDTNPASLPLAVHVRDGNGSWNTGVADVIQGKNTSPYERSYRIDLVGQGPFSIRVQRGNRESEYQDLRDQLVWGFLTEVVDVRQNYPSCALVGIEVDAKLFGNSMPSRKYLMDLSIIKVPSNYDPETREYTGFWDGTFKEAWSDNPAWCFYDLATHPIIGAGIEEVNKWALYEIAKYCDELVDDGYGGKEPRFTCNTVFSSQEDAIVALSTLASVFRGMLYWGGGAVEPVADMPGPVRRILSPADVIGGEFSYSGTSLQERHSVAVVMWNDPEDNYEAKPEMVEDADQIELLGWREARVTAVACSSRGQARRVGLWLLYSEKLETQKVSFSVPVKQFDMRPGEFFGVVDPYRSGARMGGLVRSIQGRKVELDQCPDEALEGWFITLGNVDGGLERFTITMVEGCTVTLNKSPTVPVETGAGFALSSSEIKERLFRVASVQENEGSIFTVTATEHNPGKYDYIEKGLALPDVPTSMVPTGRLPAPKDLTAETFKYLAGGSEHQGLTIGWSAPDDARVGRFILDVRGPDDVAFRTVYTEDGVSFDLLDVKAGLWRYRVRATSLEWGSSAWAEAEVTIVNLLEPLPPEALQFTTTSNSITVLPSSSGFASEFEFWRSNNPLQVADIESNATYLGTGPFFVDVPLHFDTVYYYYVRGVNIYGQSAWVSGNAKTDSNVDEILEIILKEQQETAIGKWFQEEIEKISGSIPGSVGERIGVVGGRLDSTITELEGANDILRTEIDRINLQLTEFTEAPVWEPGVEYEAPKVLQWEGKLYSTIQDVPADVPPPNPEYWEKIGDFASLSEAINDLSLRVQASSTKVDVIDGIVTPMASQITNLKALWDENEEDEDGYLEGALRQWDAQAEFVEEVRVSASRDKAMVERVTALSSSLGDLNSSLIILERSFSDEKESVASQLTSLRATIDDDVTAAITEERQARVSADQALAQDITQLGVTFGEDLNASISQEAQVRADQDEALGVRIDTVQSSASTNTAAIQSEATTRANADQALAQDISTVQASVSDALSKAEEALEGVVIPDTRNTNQSPSWYWENFPRKRVTEFKNASAIELPTSVGAQVTMETIIPWADSTGGPIVQIVSSADGLRNSQRSSATNNSWGPWRRHIETLTASVQEERQARVDLEGKVDASWGVKLQVNRNGQYVTAGVGLGLSNESGNLQSNFIVQADQFTVIQGLDGAQTVPFTINSQGKTVIRSALIGDATITMAMIKDTIQSDNYVAPRPNGTGGVGWRLHKSGQFEIHSPLPGGGRVELNNKGMRVYDENARLRVKIGDLR